MRLIEKLILGIILGAVFPILGFMLGWWGGAFFLGSAAPVLPVVVGFLLGLLVNSLFLKRWVDEAYEASLKRGMAVHLFYTVGLYGMAMGLPVFNLGLAVPAGLYMGSRLAHQSVGEAERKRLGRQTCLFTTGVLGVLCIITAVIALTDPYTAGDVQGMLGLPFEVTRPMLVGISVIGGTGLLLCNWLLTAISLHLAYAFQSWQINPKDKPASPPQP